MKEPPPTVITKQISIDVIIPVLNEEDSISLVIRDLPKNLIRNIYVCDNGSNDFSREKAEASGAIVLHEPQRGYGSACLKGVQYIASGDAEQQPEILAFIDGDYADRPAEIFLLIEKMLADDLDLVIGSRTTGKSTGDSLTLVQKFGNALATNLIQLFFGYRYSDLGPFRAIRFKKLLEMNMQDRGYGWTVEMQVKAVKMKYKVGEVPVSYHKRIGKSKISGTFKGIIGAGSKILYTIFKSFVKG